MFITTDLIKYGQDAPGIYILVEGQASLVSNQEDIMITDLEPGDFFGEVSVLFGVKATATVRVESHSVVLFIEKRVIKDMGKLKKGMTIAQWFIDRKYLPTTKELQKDDIFEGILLHALQTLPLLNGWCETSLLELIKCTDGIVVYPPHSHIVFNGDPGHGIVILIKGKMEADAGPDQEPWYILAKKYPFVLSEEGLFTQRDHIVTAKARTCCKILRVKKDDLIFVKSRFPSTARTAWDKSVSTWKTYQQNRNHEIYRKYIKILQQEFIFKMIRESAVFHNCPVGFAYHISMKCSFHEFEAKSICLTEKEYENHVSFMVVKGKVSLMENQRTMAPGDVGIQLNLKANARIVFEMEDRDMFYRSSWMPKSAHCIANSEVLLFKIQKQDIDELLKKYPETAIKEIQLEYMSAMAKQLKKSFNFKPKGKASFVKPAAKTPNTNYSNA
ncbi:uncharacterized protein LOC141914979 isoform X2 [Tubulanus polymorphus]